MGWEASKAMRRRAGDPTYAGVFKGNGIDIGAGNDCIEKHKDKFPEMVSVRDWDKKDGDAQLMASAADCSFDFVHSSHCLEHMRNPYDAIKNWMRVLKPGGHLVVTIPDWEMYEHRRWPSCFNPDHKTAWSMDADRKSDGNQVIHIPEFLESIREAFDFDVITCKAIRDHFNPIVVKDQTGPADGPECANEFVLQKKG